MESSYYVLLITFFLTIYLLFSGGINKSNKYLVALTNNIFAISFVIAFIIITTNYIYIYKDEKRGGTARGIRFEDNIFFKLN
tara:strand:+ start:2521 stop:2766 length:246 start_codon:yes stop_codon:yes gene_type:complete